MDGTMFLLFLVLLTAYEIEGFTEEEVQSRYCCHLSKETLEAMVGLNGDCPTNLFYPVVPGGDKCGSCPIGTCRMRDGNGPGSYHGCICAKDFLDKASHSRCEDNYGVSWPESVGGFNPELRSCVTTTAPPTPSPTIECTMSCENGGVIDSTTCSCQCPEEFRGPNCSQCNENYYGTDCRTFCKSSVTCLDVGRCSDDGQSCICNAGKYGSDCSCNAKDCSSDNACSGSNGQCRDSRCFCNAGFVGCSCNIQCSDQTDCSGHGKCKEDGTCRCDPGYVGAACETLDLSSYCSSGRTLSGFPCLPGVIDTLGYGYDAVRGKSTMPVLLLTFTEGRVFTIQGTSYEIPDHVTCSPVTVTDSGFLTSSFESTFSYRRHLSRSAGLSGDIQAKGNEGFFSASEEYEQVYQRSFSQKRNLFASELNHGLYTCIFQDTVDTPLTPATIRTRDSLSGSRRVERIGTHYIREATFGGKLSVFNFVESCVFSTESTQTVRSEIDANVFGLAGSASAEGSVETTSDGSCSVFEANSFYLKSVNGGKRQLLILPSARSVDDFRSWFDSLMGSPGTINMEVGHIDVFFPELSTDVKQYIESRSVSEEELSAASDDACAAASCTSSASPLKKRCQLSSLGSVTMMVVGLVLLLASSN